VNHETHERHETRLLFEHEVFRIQGAIFDVYRTLGSGFLEAVYQEALAIELSDRCIPFVQQPLLRLSYKGRDLKHGYVPDFLCFECILLELKAVRDFAPEHRAQVLNYLKAANLRLGLLVNFAATPKVRIERFAL
jgi:GxxExxY protein